MAMALFNVFGCGILCLVYGWCYRVWMVVARVRMLVRVMRLYAH